MRPPFPSAKNAAAPERPARRPRRAYLLLVGVFLLAALCYGAWSLRQMARPGRVHLDRGMDDAAAGRFREAEQEWKTGVREDPTFPGCYERLGDLYENVRDYPDAITNYAAATRLSPHDGHLFLDLASVQQDAHDSEDALVSARKAYALLPSDAAAAGLYGELAKKQHDETAAMSALRQARRLDPGNGRYLVELAGVEMDSADMADAERDLSGYLAGHPTDPRAYYLMAAIYNQKPRTPSNLNTAIGYAERSFSSGGAPPNVYPLLGQLYLSAGRVRDALTVCLLDLRSNPGDTAVMTTLIACDNRLGRPQEAAKVSSQFRALTLRQDRIDHLKEVVGFNPHDVREGLELARLEEQVSGVTQAQEYYAVLLRLNPRSPQARAALVAFLQRTGRSALARQVLNPSFVP